MEKKKPKRKRKNHQIYLILSQKGRRLYGAFPFTDEGFNEAQKYVRKITKKNGENFTIEPM